MHTVPTRKPKKAVPANNKSQHSSFNYNIHDTV
jgi:hypothetical protein